MDVDPNWVETLINAVQSKPCLYNKADSDYCNRDVKSKAWTEVCETTVPGWEDLSDQEKTLKGKEVQQRWANLRHSFLRELREQKKSKSGQAAKKRRKYMYFDELLFLLPTVEQRETVSNLQSEDEEVADVLIENVGSPVVALRHRPLPQPALNQCPKLLGENAPPGSHMSKLCSTF